MKKNRTRLISLIVVSMTLLSLLGGGTTIAGEPDVDGGPIATVKIEPGAISWKPQTENGGMVLTIAGPGDFYLRQEYPSGAQPTFKPVDGWGKALPDGVYNYELLLVPAKAKVRTEYDDARRGLEPSEVATEARVLSGSFSILNGGFVTPEAEEGGTEGKIEQGEELTDQVILDDLIVDGSACIGWDCVNGESFGFDTLRLKENNLRIKFQDTSSTASFPSNDWQITANDSSNGGASKFSIDDIDGGRTPFTIEAGAPSHSLYVDDGGRVGLGTSIPVVDLHIVSGNTPTVRLDQDGLSGWAPQIWDVGGHESWFFIRDATNGSKLPFRIQPSAPTDSLTIKSDGKVGIGTWEPSDPIHLLTDSATDATFVAERTSGATAEIGAGASSVYFGSKSSHPVEIRVSDIVTPAMTIDTYGYVGISDSAPAYPLDMGTVGNGARCTTAGVWQNGSSRASKENIRSLSVEEAMATLQGLSPVRYNHKADKAEEYVGFIAEDVPELVATNDRKALGSMDIVAVLTKVVQEQQKIMEELEAQNADLEERLGALEALVASLVQGQKE